MMTKLCPFRHRPLKQNKAGVPQWLSILILCWAMGSVLCLSQPVSADIYRYVDSNGVVHFTNAPTTPGYEVYMREGSSVPVRPASYAVRRTAYRAYNKPCTFDSYIAEAARRHGISFSLIKAVIKAESNFDHYAVSKAGACGLMQLMPKTAKELGVANPFDPRQNILGGARYLKELLNQFQGSVPLALAAYNAGPAKVQAVNGVPRIDETRGFIARVLRYLNKY
jgi:soluble lytic murein transglycosylase